MTHWPSPRHPYIVIGNQKENTVSKHTLRSKPSKKSIAQSLRVLSDIVSDESAPHYIRGRAASALLSAHGRTAEQAEADLFKDPDARQTRIVLPHNDRDEMPEDDINSPVLIWRDEADLTMKLRARGLEPELDDANRPARLLE
jgi:hypothetical protein